MKVLKTAAVLAALTMASSAFAEVTFEAYNKLSSDVVTFNHKDAADETEKVFGGLTNKIYAEILTDRIDAMVEGKFAIDDYTGRDDYGVKWKGDVSDWYVEARVVDGLITLGYHDAIWSEGSYLPIYDDNVFAGNIGSKGFTLVVRPIDGLRIAE